MRKLGMADNPGRTCTDPSDALGKWAAQGLQGLLYPVDQSSRAFACDRHQNKPAPKLIRHQHTARILLCKMRVAAMTNLKCGRRDAPSQS